jgi:hypothetical protein
MSGRGAGLLCRPTCRRQGRERHHGNGREGAELFLPRLIDAVWVDLGCVLRVDHLSHGSELLRFWRVSEN